MARVNIPTGQKTMIATVTGKSLIRYQCCACGKTVLHEYAVRASGQTPLHALSSQETKHAAGEQAKQLALQNLEKRDALLFEVFNSTHKYEKVKDPIKCPQCQTVQPWSRLPEKDGKLSFLWVFAGILLLLGLLLHVMGIGRLLPWEAWAGVGVAVAALTVWVCISSNKERRRALAMMQKDTFVPPAYYNRRNIAELTKQPLRTSPRPAPSPPPNPPRPSKFPKRTNCTM